MKSLEERVRELAYPQELDAPCPDCGEYQPWWAGPFGWHCNAGCGFAMDLSAQAPPIIMCSHCGGPLEPGDGGYRCEPCGRVVP